MPFIIKKRHIIRDGFPCVCCHGEFFQRNDLLFYFFTPALVSGDKASVFADAEKRLE
jgi:hypothetical protein